MYYEVRQWEVAWLVWGEILTIYNNNVAKISQIYFGDQTSRTNRSCRSIEAVETIEPIMANSANCGRTE